VEYLFSDYDLFAVCENTREKMVHTINTADAAMIARDAKEVAEEFVEQFRLDTPVLTEGAVSVDVEEVQVDVSGDRNRAFFGPGPFCAPGIRATYFVPFTGDVDLFKCRPSTTTSILAAVDSVQKNELVLAYERGDTNVAATKEGFDRDLSTIREYLGWVRRDAQVLNESLPAVAMQAVAARQTRLREVAQSSASLGVPIRRAGVPPSAVTTPHPMPTRRRELQPEHYDVALSFAGEQRAYVEQVATGLKDVGVSVFYDMFERSDLWGKNLVDHLADIYQKRSRYVVMFISKDYVEKAWTTHERQHAQARALLARDEYILPARFDDTDVPGMTNTVGHVDLRNTTAAELVTLIRAKVARSR